MPAIRELDRGHLACLCGPAAFEHGLHGLRREKIGMLAAQNKDGAVDLLPEGP